MLTPMSSWRGKRLWHNAAMNPVADVRDRYLPALTGLRGVAAAWVLVFHLYQYSGSPDLGPLTSLAGCGYMGVDLFFVLSGFLLSMPFHRARIDGAPMPSLLRYAWRRCKRVLPAYYVQIVLIACALLYIGNTAALTLPNLLSHALLIQNFFPRQPLLNGIYWTMPIEWDFYVALPLLLVVFVRLRGVATWIVLFALTLAFRYACIRANSDAAWGEWIYYGHIMQLPARLDEFFYGIVGAWIYLRYPISVRTARLLVVAGVIGIIGAMAAFHFVGDFIGDPKLPWTLLYFTWMGVSFGAIVLGAAVTPHWLDARPIAWLGLVSYSLYLWHYPLLKTAQYFGWTAWGNGTAFLQNTLVLAPGILLVSWLSQHLVERPFLVARSRRGRTHGMPASLEN
jgi:peptidoglycan/LPS O-acetylase OafA/YrhL